MMNLTQMRMRKKTLDDEESEELIQEETASPTDETISPAITTPSNIPRYGQVKRQFKAEDEELLVTACEKIIKGSGILRADNVMAEICKSGGIFKELSQRYSDRKLYNKVKY